MFTQVIAQRLGLESDLILALSVLEGLCLTVVLMLLVERHLFAAGVLIARQAPRNARQPRSEGLRATPACPRGKAVIWPCLARMRATRQRGLDERPPRGIRWALLLPDRRTRSPGFRRGRARSKRTEEPHENR